MAKGFAQAGASIVLLDINEERLNQRVNELSTITTNVTGFYCNVLDEYNVKSTLSEIIFKFKRVDILVNAAGGNVPSATIGINQTVFDLSFENLKKANDLNFWGTVIPTMIIGKQMAQQKKGFIINPSSAIKVVEVYGEVK